MRRLFSTIAVALVLFTPIAFPILSRAADAPQAVITTSIPIPGSPVEQSVEGFARGRVKDLGGYISTIYTFLVSIVGVVAAVSMIYGGFLWMTSGGAADRAKAGQKRITDSLVGLVLAFGAYLLLNTINPDLVNFKPLVLPRVTTERANFQKILGGDVGTLCKSDADCEPPLTCLVVKEAPNAAGLRWFGEGLAIAVSLPFGSASIAAKGLYAVGKGVTVGAAKAGAKLAMKFVGSRWIAYPVIAAAGGASAITATGATTAAGYLAWKEISDLGYKGVCAQEAYQEVAKGELCSKDSHCKPGLTCRKEPSQMGGNCADCGICGDGSVGSFCYPETYPCSGNLKCAKVGSGSYFCSDGAIGAACESASDCKDGMKCQGEWSGFSHCTPDVKGTLWASCGTDQDCLHGDDPTRSPNDYSVDDPRYFCLRPSGNLNCNSGNIDLRCVCAAKYPYSANKAGFPCYRGADCASGNYCKSKADGQISTGETPLPSIGACQKS